MTSQAVMKRYLTSVAKNNEEYKDNKSMQTLASLIANYKNLDAEDKEVLDAKIESAYNKLQAKGVSASKSTSKATTTRKAKSSTDGGLKAILAELKKKLGAEKFRDATRGTDIKKDIQIPALKKGKRIVRKKGYTSNFYGRFKNKVGSTYYENRANRYDANQPSQTRKYKLADGGSLGNIGDPFSFDVKAKNKNGENVERTMVSYSSNEKMAKEKLLDFLTQKLKYTNVKISNGRKGHHPFAKGGELEEKGNLNRWSNSGLDEIIKRHEVITEQVRFAFAKILGLDKAYELLFDDNVGISPYTLVERAVSSDLLLINEIDENLINSAIEESEDSRRYSENGEGIGSSDITYMLKYMLDGAGLKTDFVKNTLQRVDNNGNVIQLKNELPKTTMFAQGGEVEDELIEYTIPTWALSSLINGDDSGLQDEDIEKIDKFVSEVVDTYGNANFMLGEESEESHFSYFNDIDSLGSDVTILYIRPSKKYAKGGKLSSKAKYIPKRDIAEIEVEKNGKSKSIDGANLLDGVYVKKGTKYARGGEIEVGSIVNLPEIKMKDGRVQYERVVGGEVIGIEDGIYDVLNPKTNRLHRVTKQQIEQIDQAKAKHTRSRGSLRSNEDTYPKGTEFAKGGKTSEEYAVSGILSENDEIEIISKHKTFASALVKMNKMWDEGKLDKYLEVRVRPISKSMQYAKGGTSKRIKRKGC